MTKKRTLDDPHEIERRLEYQIHLLLQEMEDEPKLFSYKDRKDVIACVGMYLNRKYGWSDEVNEPSGAGAGSAIKRYSGAFKTSRVGGANVSGVGKNNTRRLAAVTTTDDATDEPDTAA